jgi:hypothetical protein
MDKAQPMSGSRVTNDKRSSAHLGQERVSSLQGRVVGLDDRVLGVDRGRVGRLEGLLGRRREVGLLVLLLDGSRSSLGAGLGRGGPAADELLGLGGVVSHVLLSDLSVLGCGLLRSLTELGGLRADDLGRLAEVLVDELLVRRVEERGEEEDSGGNQGKAPVGNDLDEVVRDEGGDGGLQTIRTSSQKIPKHGKMGLLRGLTAAEA